MPILRQIMGWLSGVSADYPTLKRGLTKQVFARPPGGHNLFMLPGGVAEVSTACPGTHTVVWKKRRGLVKLALETGARLTPVYVFGGNDFFHQSLTSDSYLSRLSKRLGLALVVFWGRFWFLPVVPLKPKDGVTIAIGELLPSRRTAKENGKPSDKEIEELHSAYEDGLRKVFEETKVAAGYKDAVLHVQ